MTTRLLLAVTLVVAGVSAGCVKELVLPVPCPEVSYLLNGANLEWPCQSTRNIYMQSGRYISRNVIATRTQIYKDKAFVALPRYKSGVPFTLGVFSLKGDNCHATLAPFPCWSIQEEGNCQALQSVVDIFLDPRGILWALDVGIVNTLEQPVRRCPAKVVGLDVKTGKVVKVLDLSALTTAHSRPQYILVDHTKDGRAFVYVSDAAARAILVLDAHTNKAYRVVLPKAVTSGCSHRDVLYMTLVRKSCGNFVYFTYLGSSRLFSIKSSVLRKGHCSGAIVDVGAKTDGRKIVLLGTNNGADIFLRYKGESEIYVWNSETCFKADNLQLAQKGDDCRLATQVMPGYKNVMWVIESNFHDFIANSVGCVGAHVQLHPLVNCCDE